MEMGKSQNTPSSINYPTDVKTGKCILCAYTFKSMKCIRIKISRRMCFKVSTVKSLKDRPVFCPVNNMCAIEILSKCIFLYCAIWKCFENMFCFIRQRVENESSGNKNSQSRW